MNTPQVLEALIPMLVMLVTFVGLALRVQTNLRRSVDRSIDKFRNELRKDCEDDRKELKDFRAEVLDRFETTNHKIDATAAGDRERFETFRGDTREDFKELGDKIDTNAATHDRNIREVGDQVAGFKERVSRVEGYIEATSGGQWPAAGSR